MTRPVAFCIVLMVCLLPATCPAQCVGDICRPSATPHGAVARIVSAEAGGVRCYGSGTLVHRDDTRSVVLTCSHLFADGADNVSVTFPGGRGYAAKLLCVDRAWDLAALEIGPTDRTPVSVADDYPRPGEPLESCGYGRAGGYWCNRGKALGYVKTAGGTTWETLELSGTARQGDSGGPVFNRRGQLAAVLWGTDGRTVEATYCGRIRKFLARVFGRLKPAQRPNIPADSSPPQENPSRLGEIRARLDKLENLLTVASGLKSRIEEVETTGGENVRAVAREVAIATLADRAPGAIEAILPGLLAALGWTGPPALAAIFALKLAAAMLRRRRRKRSQLPTSDLQPPTSNKPLNDEYASQLAGVYALSGRSPIADVTLGREYDEQLRQAHQSSDPALAGWARQLRDRVARKFYRIHDQSPLPADPVGTTTKE